MKSYIWRRNAIAHILNLDIAWKGTALIQFQMSLLLYKQIQSRSAS